MCKVWMKILYTFFIYDNRKFAERVFYYLNKVRRNIYGKKVSSIF